MDSKVLYIRSVALEPSVAGSDTFLLVSVEPEMVEVLLGKVALSVSSCKAAFDFLFRNALLLDSSTAFRASKNPLPPATEAAIIAAANAPDLGWTGPSLLAAFDFFFVSVDRLGTGETFGSKYVDGLCEDIDGNDTVELLLVKSE